MKTIATLAVLFSAVSAKKLTLRSVKAAMAKLDRLDCRENPLYILYNNMPAVYHRPQNKEIQYENQGFYSFNYRVEVKL